MPNIYRKAPQVLIWPGSIRLNPVNRYLVNKATTRQIEWEQIIRLAKIAAKTPGFTKFMDEVKQSRYWGRTWIIQEIFLAQQPLRILGSHFIHVWEFTKFYDAFQGGWFSIIPDEDDEDRRKDQLKKICRAPRSARDIDLSNCMLLSGNSKCFDTRDRAYSMRGMCDELSSLPVRYQVDEAGLLLDVCCHLKPVCLYNSRE